MMPKTIAEKVFEDFCDANKIKWEKIMEGHQKTPDYKVQFGDDFVFIEVKQIDKDQYFHIDGEVSGRTVGSHIREKIKTARKQIKVGADQGCPSILLVYNNLDGLQMFGTGQDDFIAAMYGDLTYVIDKNRHEFIDQYHGRNQSFAENKSAYFSAVGFLYQTINSSGIRLYENAFTNNKLNFNCIPKCIEVVRIKLT
ncbi:MAG: hypothetical protein JW863_05630 [Chitinispirillaceae bacterium]|nr:hypothetical protein [Chitinispirillaceae bacterium]